MVLLGKMMVAWAGEDLVGKKRWAPLQEIGKKGESSRDTGAERGKELWTAPRFLNWAPRGQVEMLAKVENTRMSRQLWER